MVDDDSRAQRAGAARRRWWAAGAIIIAVAVAAAVWAIAVANGSGSSTEAPTVSTPSSTSEAPLGAPTAPASGTSVPAPSVHPAPTGTLDAELPRETQSPVPLDAVARATGAVSVQLTSIEAVQGEAVVPTEISGPALRLTLEATNAGGDSFETPAVVVNLYMGGERLPASAVSRPGGRPFPPEIPAGGSAAGVYLFTVPAEHRDVILVEVELQVGESIVLFEGPAD